MKKIVYKTETGIAIITPARSIAAAMKDIPKGAEYKIVDEAELPKDRTYRNAWKYDLTIDSVKAAKIDEERAEAAELAAMPDLVKSMKVEIENLKSKVTVLETAKETTK